MPATVGRPRRGRDEEYWVEINIGTPLAYQNGILLDVIRPFVNKLRARGALMTYHYFREPELRFRLRVASEKERERAQRSVARLADGLVRKGIAEKWWFGRHGEAGARYEGEEDRYGKEGWKVAQRYFNTGSEISLMLLSLKRDSNLENPLWGKGLGNPWEGGKGNPWTEVVPDPLAYHWSRYVHLFSNQVGFGIEDEVRLCERQSDKYSRVLKETGQHW